MIKYEVPKLPRNCGECIFTIEGDDSTRKYCGYTDKYVGVIGRAHRAKGCPLKEEGE